MSRLNLIPFCQSSPVVHEVLCFVLHGSDKKEFKYPLCESHHVYREAKMNKMPSLPSRKSLGETVHFMPTSTWYASAWQSIQLELFFRPDPDLLAPNPRQQYILWLSKMKYIGFEVHIKSFLPLKYYNNTIIYNPKWNNYSWFGLIGILFSDFDSEVSFYYGRFFPWFLGI